MSLYSSFLSKSHLLVVSYDFLWPVPPALRSLELPTICMLIPESMAEVIRPRSNEPQPQVFLPETLRTPSVRCCPRNSTFHEARMQPGPSSSQLVTIRNSDDVHRVLLCSSPWGSQTSRKGILRDLAIVLNIEYPSQHTKVTVITL